ncbi:MAG: beta-lactamase family protein [Burkholderiaceae bacterium]|nr:beta-lactamase family protein [Burkholderiaceae bacterium]
MPVPSHTALKKIAALCIQAALLGALAACQSPPPKPEAPARGDYASTRQYLSQLIRYEMKRHAVTGLSIALVDDQRIVWAEGFGHADRAVNLAAAPETVYRVGSISKLFTDTAVMQLAEQGRLDIDQPLQAYLPQFSIRSRFAGAGPITPRNLMTHHSGLPDSFVNGMWTDHPAPFSSVTAALRDDYAAYPPDYVFAYSNIGITLLGDMIQTVTGEDFAARLERTLLRPLGMRDSSFAPGLSGPLASKAYRDGKEADEKPLRDVPAGGLNSNVLDLSRFMQMMFAEGRANGRQILRPATVAQMLAPQNGAVALDQDFRIGLGWMLNSKIDNAGPVAQHAGATLFHRGQLTILPQHKLGVVVLSNSATAGGVVTDVATAALQQALEAKTGIRQTEPKRLEPAPAALTPDQLESWPGQYATHFGYAKVSKNGDRLRATLADADFDLSPRGAGKVGLRYRLLGLIPLSIDALDKLHLSQALVSGRDVLLAEDGGRTMLGGERITPRPIPQKWLDRLGDYAFVNAKPGEDGVVIDKVALVQRDGLLMIDISVPDMPGESGLLPIEAVSDSEAIVSGIGRGKGETIRVIEIDGAEHVAYSGFLLRKKAR